MVMSANPAGRAHYWAVTLGKSLTLVWLCRAQWPSGGTSSVTTTESLNGTGSKHLGAVVENEEECPRLYRTR